MKNPVIERCILNRIFASFDFPAVTFDLTTGWRQPTMCMSCADLNPRPPKALDPTYNAGLYTRNFVIVNTRWYFIDFILFSQKFHFSNLAELKGGSNNIFSCDLAIAISRRGGSGTPGTLPWLHRCWLIFRILLPPGYFWLERASVQLLGDKEGVCKLWNCPLMIKISSAPKNSKWLRSFVLLLCECLFYKVSWKMKGAEGYGPKRC